MGSRYCHVAWQDSQLSSVSCASNKEHMTDWAVWAVRQPRLISETITTDNHNNHADWAERHS